MKTIMNIRKGHDTAGIVFSAYINIINHEENYPKIQHA